MIDVQKHIAYWRDGAKEDWEFGEDAIQRAKTRPGLFFIHLALEKMVKAHVVKTTKNIPPKIHDLKRLADIGKLNVNQEQIRIIGRINRFNLEGRYPDALDPPPSLQEAQAYLKQAREIYQWLLNQL